MNDRHPCEELTERERRVLDAKCLGLSRIEAAEIVGVKPRTYDSDLRIAKARCQCATLYELVSKYTAWKLTNEQPYPR